jgi:hypothetical protein
MHDNIFERDGHDERPRENADRPVDVPGPLADREVPLPPVATSDVIHRWLDGEMPEPSGSHSDASRSVEFWRRIEEETTRRRHMVTPAYLSAKIMASLPSTQAVPVAAPWWKKSIHITPGMAMALVAGAFALGIIVMRLFAVR